MNKQMGGPVCMLKRSQLHPHPDNPRKNLGDLEELRESIRAHGIMQNLTVVPVDDDLNDFKILIGHRRFAASEGILYELPCVIVEGLSDREQVGIMLCENIQRNDLTWYEQGRGFQMMMDLGDDIDAIKEKTGFSEKTIKHRLEIAKLDQKTLEKDRSWQLSLSDLIELEKVKDLKQREKILKESYSSDNFKERVKIWIREENIKNNLKAAKKILKDLGIGENKGAAKRWSSDYMIVKEFDLRKDIAPKLVDFECVADRTKVDYFSEVSYSSLYIMRKKGKEAKRKKTKEELEEEQRRKTRKQLNEAHQAVVKMYADFILELPENPRAIPNKPLRGADMLDELNEAWKLFMDTGSDPNPMIPMYSVDERNKIADKLQQSRPFIQMIFCVACSLYYSDISSWQGFVDEETSEAHKRMTKLLERYGFVMPIYEYKSIIDGTSELFRKEKKT